MYKLKKLGSLLLCSCLLLSLAQTAQSQQSPGRDTDNTLLYAAAWKQTAAEYRALYHQGFNIARMRVELALANLAPDSKPLAIISDIDETLLLANDYWGYLINQGLDFFDDESWDQWVAQNRSLASPGALEFLRFCRANNVEVFYVTNRDQGEETHSLALANLNHADFPYADDRHLTVLRETSNKENIQQQIRENYAVVAMLGDNLNDFARRYYVADVDQRLDLMEQDREKYGRDYILFPNPTDGHWIRAIFGDSEPAATARNRRILKAAASRSAWSR